MNSKSGISLSEVIICTLILGFIMSLGSDMLIRSMRISREENGVDFLRKEAIKATNWVNNDLRRTSGNSFTYNIDPVTNVPRAISFLTNQANVINNKGIDANSVVANPNWNGYIIYYLISDPKNPAMGDLTQKYILNRGTINPVNTSDSYLLNSYYDKVFMRAGTFISAPKTLQTTDLTTAIGKFISNTATTHAGTVARNIYEMNVTEQNSTCVTLTIETRTKNPRGGELKVIYTSKIFMRNSNLNK
jgi:hypothetical protein